MKTELKKMTKSIVKAIYATVCIEILVELLLVRCIWDNRVALAPEDV